MESRSGIREFFFFCTEMFVSFYTILPNFSMKYLVMRKVHTDVDGIKKSYAAVVYLYVDIIHSLKLVDYVHVQADKP